MFHYAIPLLEKKPDYVILHVGTNDAPYKGGSDISNEILELMRFIKEKHPGCKKITLSTPIIRTDNYNANKENERFISSLNKSDVSYITHDNIIKKHLYRDGLHLNRIGFTILAENFKSFIRRDWLLNNQIRNQSTANEANSSEYQKENSDNLTKGLKILRLKYAQNPIIAQININSIRNKFELLVSQIASNIDSNNDFRDEN